MLSDVRGELCASIRYEGFWQAMMLSDMSIKAFCQEAGAGADRVRNNSLLSAKESNYRLQVECLCLQRCLPSHSVVRAHVTCSHHNITPL